MRFPNFSPLKSSQGSHDKSIRISSSIDVLVWRLHREVSPSEASLLFSATSAPHYGLPLTFSLATPLLASASLLAGSAARGPPSPRRPLTRAAAWCRKVFLPGKSGIAYETLHGVGDGGWAAAEGLAATEMTSLNH
eukprot:jgi/Botrbrau1/14013/Bobra.0296s0007.1